MECPFCSASTFVVDMREGEGGSIRRRRQCSDCQRRFTTVETPLLVAVSRAGVFEPFSRQSVITRVRTAAQRNAHVVDAHARSRREKPRAPVSSSTSPHSNRQDTETSTGGASSPFPLVPALGRS
ncbi:hypothetical protein [Streptomyces lavendulocolor]|uniref:NrdR family transcriptional regulator n=1 Tax=Streptomyces lavendulocolor TaxID=67316 RepID=UPI003C2BD949